MPLSRGGLRLVDGATFAFASGGRQTLQIPVPAKFIKRIYLFLQGTLTVSAVTVPGTIHSDGPANLVQLLELLVDGFPLKVGAGPSFLRIAQKYDQTEGVNNGLFTGAAGVYTFEAMIPLLLEMPSSVSPIDSYLDGRKVRNIVLNLTWGTTASIVIGNTSTLALSGTTVQVYLDETAPFAVKGDFWKMRESEVTLAGVLTSPSTRFLLPFNDRSVYRSIQLRAIDGSDLSDAIINTLSFRINGGQEIPLNTLDDDFFQALGNHIFGVDVMPDGYYHLEVSEGGRVLTTGLGSQAKPGEINSLEIIADTTVGAGATSIVAHLVEMMPPKSKAA